MFIEFANRTISGSLGDIWRQILQAPDKYSYQAGIRKAETYCYADFTAEVYYQNNGPGTFQKVVEVIPHNLQKAAPAVVVPFYYPEAMVGFDLATQTADRYAPIAMLAHLAQRGFIAISAETYHLTYIKSDTERMDFKRWHQAGAALNLDYPEWCGMGKLLADTQLLLDILVKDTRVDATRIGIAGHSLGGKMAYYTGCLDDRIQVIMASDFGINWDQSNWNDIWYFGDKLESMQKAGLEQWQLLDIAKGKPFLLIAGQFDNMASFDSMKRSSNYYGSADKLQIINHATGHTPPPDALKKGYDFLEKYLSR